MSTDLTKKIELPERVQLTLDKDQIIVTGPKGTVKRTFPTKIVSIELQNKEVIIKPLRANAQARALVGTFKAHIKNMISGVQNPFVYKLKVCSSHFPISVKLVGNELQILNFFGEKKPRKVKVLPGVDIKVEGDLIIVESPDKELAGRMASNIEQATRIRARDRRIFQDGIYIIEKAGKPI